MKAINIKPKLFGAIVVFLLATVVLYISIIEFRYSFQTQEASVITGTANESSLMATDHILIKFKQPVVKEKVTQVLAKYKLKERREIKGIGVKIVDISRTDTPLKVIERLNLEEKGKSIEYAEPDYFALPALTANDTYYVSGWHLVTISAPQAWEITRGNSSVPIAFIDSGIDPTQPDLAGKIIPGYNFYDNNTDTRDVYAGHGTGVSGVAAALTNNNRGISGISWNSPIMPLRASDSAGFFPYSSIASALTYAADQGVRVINISVAGASPSLTLQNAVNYAWNKGSVIIAAAGNTGNNILQYPAALDNVIAVSATTQNDTLASFSSYGEWIDVSAPGSNIYTTRPGGYAGMSGTSLASPIVAGEAALILSAHPSFTNSQIVSAIQQGVDDIGSLGFDPNFGWGRINLSKALAWVPVASPSLTITSDTIFTKGATATASSISKCNTSSKIEVCNINI